MSAYSDWIVGGAAILVGCAIGGRALLSMDRAAEYPKVRWLEGRIGRPATRLFLVAVGIGLIILGVAIALGWKAR